MRMRPAIPPDICKARVLAFLATCALPLEIGEIRERCNGLRAATVGELVHAIGSLMADGLVRERIVSTRIGHQVHATPTYYAAPSSDWLVALALEDAEADAEGGRL